MLLDVALAILNIWACFLNWHIKLMFQGAVFYTTYSHYKSPKFEVYLITFLYHLTCALIF